MMVSYNMLLHDGVCHWMLDGLCGQEKCRLLYFRFSHQEPQKLDILDFQIDPSRLEDVGSRIAYTALQVPSRGSLQLIHRGSIPLCHQVVAPSDVEWLYKALDIHHVSWSRKRE